MRMEQGVRAGLGHGGITCVLQTQFSSLSFEVIPLCLFFPNIIVYTITVLRLGISSRNFIGIFIRLGRYITHKNDCTLFLSSQVMLL